MTDEERRTALIEQIQATRERWLKLVADVGEARVEEPGAMGDWTFKDVAAHLTAWRQRTVDRLQAAARGEPEPPPPWPQSLATDEDDPPPLPQSLGTDEDDPINAWIHERTKDRPAAQTLAEADSVYDDFVAVVRALPIQAVAEAGRFAWLEGEALADVDFGDHLAEHDTDVRGWLARS